MLNATPAELLTPGQQIKVGKHIRTVTAVTVEPNELPGWQVAIELAPVDPSRPNRHTCRKFASIGQVL